MLLANPQYNRTTVKTLASLAQVIATAYQAEDTSAPPGQKSMSGVFAYCEETNQYYAFDPDSLVLADSSLGFPFGNNVVFARSALNYDPLSFVPGFPPLAGNQQAPGRWFAFGEISQSRNTDVALAVAPLTTKLFTDLLIGVNAALKDIEIDFSCAWNVGANAIAGTEIAFAVTVDGFVQPNGGAIVSAPTPNQKGTTSVSVKVTGVAEGLRTINVVGSSTVGTAVVTAALGHCTVAVEVLGA